MPLMLGLAPGRPAHRGVQQSRPSASRQWQRVTAGDIGFMYLMRALSDAGRSDVLYDVVCQEDGPGYMYQLKKGATTMTETWDCYPELVAEPLHVGSRRGVVLRGLGGIVPTWRVGFKRFVVAPQVVGDLTSATASYRSMYGQIISHWRRQGTVLTLAVTVPPTPRPRSTSPPRTAIRFVRAISR